MQKQTDSKANQPYMQRIQNSENLEFKKQELKKKIEFHGVKNIEKKIRLY